MVKWLKWFLPFAFTTLLVIPSLGAKAIPNDPLQQSITQAPSRSALKSNRYTQLEPAFTPVTANAFASLTGYTYRETFGDYAFYDLATDGSFRVVELSTGYVWSSTVDYDYFLLEASPLADPGDLGLNLFWQSKLRSPFFLTYYQGLNLREEHAFQHHLSRFTFQRVTLADAVGFDVEVFLFLSKIRFQFSVRFNHQGLFVEIPFDSIEEGGDFALAGISLYPMLGATKRARTPGYVAIPDGVGALIRYTDDPAIGVYSKRYYGGDEGFLTATAEAPLFANMYGIVHGHQQHAMLAIIEKGAAQGILNHFGSQVFLDFNFTYVTFVYRTTYRQFLNQAKTSSVDLLQKDATANDVGIRYQFLQGQQASYVGLAQQYGAWRFAEATQVSFPSAIPLHLDVLALESKPGLFAREKVVMTNLDDLQAMVLDLQSNLTEVLYVQYLGWQSGGYSYTAPRFVALDPALGNLATLLSLSLQLAAPSHFHLAVDPYRGYLRGGGYQNGDISQSIGQEFLTSGDYYRLSSRAGQQTLTAIRDRLQGWGLSGVALETVANQTYSDFGRQPVHKETMIAEVKSLITAEDTVYQPMSYAWDAGALLDLPMYSSEQAKFTDTVPLIPYMVAGHRPGFGRAGNFFSNTTNELLRMIDYHLYPAFFVTEASAYALMDTPSEHIFTSRYQDWRPEIQNQYDFISGALLSVMGQPIQSRDVLALGVVKITYANDVEIYVNYGGTTFVDEAVTVSPMNYTVKGGNA